MYVVVKHDVHICDIFSFRSFVTDTADIFHISQHCHYPTYEKMRKTRQIPEGNEKLHNNLLHTIIK